MPPKKKSTKSSEGAPLKYSPSPDAKRHSIKCSVSRSRSRSPRCTATPWLKQMTARFDAINPNKPERKHKQRTAESEAEAEGAWEEEEEDPSVTQTQAAAAETADVIAEQEEKVEEGAEDQLEVYAGGAEVDLLEETDPLGINVLTEKQKKEAVEWDVHGVIPPKRPVEPQVIPARVKNIQRQASSGSQDHAIVNAPGAAAASSSSTRPQVPRPPAEVLPRWESRGLAN